MAKEPMKLSAKPHVGAVAKRAANTTLPIASPSDSVTASLICMAELFAPSSPGAEWPSSNTDSVERAIPVPSPASDHPVIATPDQMSGSTPVSYTHLRAHETDSYLVCRLLLEKKK